MKMEVLPVQNQFQRQFGVLGSNKVQDWTTPLSPPSTTNSNNNNNSSNKNSSTQLNGSNNVINHHHHNHHHHHHHNHQEPPITILSTSSHEEALQVLTARLQMELREAKIRHLACTEVLLPADLLSRVVTEMFIMSEKEPCGIRGCTIFIEFEDEPGNTRRIASMKVDSSAVSSFELYLTIKHDRSGWTSIIPQFLKNLARSSTVVISPDFTLTKNKLYRSFSE